MQQEITNSIIVKQSAMKNIKYILQSLSGIAFGTISSLRKYRYTILLAALAIPFSSCEDIIEVEVDDQNSDLYAVEAKITTNDQPTVFLSKGLPVTVDEAFKGISGAVVTIKDDVQPSNEVILVEDPDSSGLYIVPAWTEYKGFTGREYTLTIEVDGVSLEARDYLYPVEPIDSIQVRPSSFGENEFLAVTIFSQETPGVGNHYKWDIYINDTLLGDAESMFFASDELVDGNYVDDLEIFIDYYDDNQDIERKLNYLDTVVVYQNSISEYAYNFYFQMQQQSFGGGLFSVPPANVKSNFTSSNGKDVLGMFTAQDVSVSNLVVIDDSIEKLLDK